MKWLEKLKLILRAGKYRRRNDPGGIRYLLHTIQAGQTAFDIGAHKGAYLYFFRRRVGSGGAVVAFEPQASLYAYLQKAVKWFGWENVEVERLALSDAEGTASLYVPANKRDPSSPGATIVAHPEKVGERVEAVATESLDAFCARRNVYPDFLKIDVEGNELNIFSGGIQTLQRKRPCILVEIEARHVGRERAEATFAFLEKLGYRGYFILGPDLLPLDRFDFGRHQQPGRKPYCNNFVFEPLK